MEAMIKHDASNSYLVMKEETISKREEFLLRMITENQIPGLLQATRNQFNEEGEIYYHVNGYISFGEYCEKRQLGQQDFMRLLLALQGVIGQMEEYLLDANSLLLNPETLFLSTSKETYAFCLYPFTQKDIRTQIQNLGEYLLNHINHQEEKVVKMAYQFYRLTREENFEIRQVVEELVREIPIQDALPQQEEPIQSPMEKMESGVLPETHFGEKIGANKKETSFSDKLPDMDKKCFLFLCFPLAAFLFFIYTCILKRYYYGYSFIPMLFTVEVQVSFFAFVAIFLFSILFFWRQKRKKAKEVVEVSKS